MIIVRLLGGLGNQMFQYAAGRALALRLGAPLKLDLSAYEEYPLRGYRLNHFRIEADVADPTEVARVARSRLRGLRRRLHRAIERRKPYYGRRVVREPHFHYDPNLRRVRGDAYLIGFWQSEKYFAEIREPLLRELSVAEPPDAANRRTLDEIDAADSVSLHIRRGDYVTDPRNRAFHGSCTLDYYRTAIESLVPSLRNPHLFVFSDDIPWARENLRATCPISFMDHNAERGDYEDMRLMSRCKHHIIANSTFSWWGAWLSNHPGKTVIAPTRWFDDPATDYRDVIPQDWRRI